MDALDAVDARRFGLTIGGQEGVLEAGDRRVMPKPVMHTAEGVSDEPVVSRDGVRMG